MFFYFTINLLLFFVNILVIYGEENVKVMSNKEAYDDLKRRLSSIKKSCGDVCDQTIEGNIQRGPSMIWFFYTCCFSNLLNSARMPAQQHAKHSSHII